MSPRARARMTGFLCVLEGLTSVAGQLVIPGSLVVSGDAAATAANILGNAQLFELGVTASLLAVAFHTAQTVLFYDLFKPVGKSLVLLFAFFSLVAIGLQAVSGLFQLPARVILDGASGLGSFRPEESQALAYLFLRWRAQVFNIYLGFFGFRCAIIGYLICKSTFLPRIVGVMMALAGLGYLTFLWPPLASFASPFNLALAAPGELSLVLWLLVVGVNSQRWLEQARAAEEKSLLATQWRQST